MENAGTWSKTHFNQNGRPKCGLRTAQLWTKDVNQVTCQKCLMKLGKKTISQKLRDVAAVLPETLPGKDIDAIAICLEAATLLEPKNHVGSYARKENT